MGSKSEPGLFPPTSRAKSAAEHCKDEGFLRVVRKEAKGKLDREICVLTDKGRHFLIRQSNPREVLEDFVRVLEQRHADVETLAGNVREMQRSLDGIRSAVEQILPRLVAGGGAGQNGTNHDGVNMNGIAVLNSPQPPTRSTASDGLMADVREKLAEWHAAAGASEDCPLPELYRRLEKAGSVSIGQFHDCVRRLHDEQIIYLHPWTGPLYALPEPAFALLVGHEIGYYASIR